MRFGSIQYSPDYKSEKTMIALTNSVAGAIDKETTEILERARLEREILAAARMFTKEDAVNWDRLVSYRRLFAAVEALEKFESQQKSK